MSPLLCSFSCILQAEWVTPFTDLLLVLLLYCNYLCCRLMFLLTVSSLKLGIFFHIHYCILCTRNNAGKRKHTICYSNELFWDSGRGHPIAIIPVNMTSICIFVSVCVGFSIHTYKITVKKKKVADSLTWVITKQSWALGIDSPERLEIIRQKDYKL